MAQHYRNWPVPHDSRLERSMQLGQMFTIRGRIIDEIPEEGEAARITINLAGDARGRNAHTIAMHMNIRFDRNETVFNSNDRGQWQKEEKEKLPFKAGDEFDIRIRAIEEKFEIMVNQKEFHDFDFRIPLDQITNLFIDGPIVLYNIMWGGRFYSVPYESRFEGGFTTGKSLLISGVPEKKCKIFHVNLITDSGDIALHFNPRFSEEKVVRNSQENGGWGSEEKEGNFPFKHDVGFDLLIKNESYSFQVYVDGERFCTFGHRMDPNSITRLEVDGDELELQAIQVLYA